VKLRITFVHICFILIVELYTELCCAPLVICIMLFFYVFMSVVTSVKYFVLCCCVVSAMGILTVMSEH